jgi:hypothetical protein
MSVNLLLGRFPTIEGMLDEQLLQSIALHN